MKNNFKIVIVIAMFFFFPFIVKGETKDFCKTGQQYKFDCKDMVMQCSYKKKDSASDDVYYINAGYIKRSLSYIYSKNNGSERYNVVDANINGKTIADYIKSYKCPPVALLVKTKNQKQKYDRMFVGDNASDIKAAVEKAYGEIESSDDYSLSGQSINSQHSSDFGQKKTYDGKPNVSSCAGFKNENDCKSGWTSSGSRFGCAWNSEYGFCSPSGLTYLSCGSSNNKTQDATTGEIISNEKPVYDIPIMVPKLISYAILGLKTATPIILIIMGIVKLTTSIAKQNEDDMKKARSTFIKNIIAAVLIFFTTTIVQFIISIAADNGEMNTLTACLDCFINNSCENAEYYTDGYGNCYSVKKPGTSIACPVDSNSSN